MSIFPQLTVNINNIIEEENDTMNDIIREYAWDFINNDFRLIDGKFVIVEGKEALKIWIWKALHTKKDRYEIYSKEYGHSLEDLIGKGYSKGLVESEARRLTWECLKINNHIKSIENFKVSFEGDRLEISFNVNTNIGLISIDKVSV